MRKGSLAGRTAGAGACAPSRRTRSSRSAKAAGLITLPDHPVSDSASASAGESLMTRPIPVVRMTPI